MAEIKMDVTEYEEMKKNARLLEDSLEREKELSGKIDKLKQEQIDSLKKNEKKIVKIRQTFKSEVLLQKRSESDILRELERMFYDHQRGMTPMYGKHLFDRLSNSFFEKITSEGESPSEEVTIHGLDDVKQDIVAELRSGVEGEVINLKNKVKVMEDTEKRNNDKILAAEITEEKLADANKVNNQLIDDKEKLGKKVEALETLTTNLETKLDRTLSELNRETFLTRKQTIMNAKSIIELKIK